VDGLPLSPLLFFDIFTLDLPQEGSILNFSLITSPALMYLYFTAFRRSAMGRSLDDHKNDWTRHFALVHAVAFWPVP
jgi:hypothetical protein